MSRQHNLGIDDWFSRLGWLALWVIVKFSLGVWFSAHGSNGVHHGQAAR